MKDLKFPIIREPLPPPPQMSMDQYVAFIQFNWMHIVDREAIREQKIKSMPKEPFRLK